MAGVLRYVLPALLQKWMLYHWQKLCIFLSLFRLAQVFSLLVLSIMHFKNNKNRLRLKPVISGCAVEFLRSGFNHGEAQPFKADNNYESDLLHGC